MNMLTVQNNLHRIEANQMTVFVITSLTDFVSLKEEWERILEDNREDNLYYSFDWYYAASHFYIQPICSPFIICVKEQERLVAILPCCISKRRLRLFSFQSLELIGNIYSAYRGGIVVKGKEHEVARAIATFLMENNALWNILYFEDMPESDPFLDALIQVFRRKKSIVRLSEQYAKIVISPESGKGSQDYWRKRSKNLRQQIQRSINKMNREGTFMIVPTFQPGEDIHSAMDDYYEIFRHSWKEPEIDPRFHRELAAHLLSKGKLRLFTLYFKCRGSDCPDHISHAITSCECSLTPVQCAPEGYLPIATSFYAVSGRYACLLKTAYHEDHAVYSAGTVLTWFALKWLLDQDNVSLIDFQKEADPYKYKWGKLKEVHMLLQVANPRNPAAILEIWGEKRIVPELRKIKKRLFHS
jgi:hypothetical protein